MQNLDELSSEILSAVEAADTTDALEAVRIDALGKKGRISLMTVSYTHLRAHET